MDFNTRLTNLEQRVQRDADRLALLWKISAWGLGIAVPLLIAGLFWTARTSSHAVVNSNASRWIQDAVNESMIQDEIGNRIRSDYFDAQKEMLSIAHDMTNLRENVERQIGYMIYFATISERKFTILGSGEKKLDVKLKVEDKGDGPFYSITFATPLLEKPSVIVTPISNNALAQVSSITKSGFELYLFDPVGETYYAGDAFVMFAIELDKQDNN